jgi:formate dehydrogenase/NADH-quinone oxidoreductase subunit F
LRSRYNDDADVELVEVSCLGRCDVAPAAAINERPAALADIEQLVEAARAGDVGTVAAKTRTEPWPNDPYPAGSGAAERYTSLRALLTGDLQADDIVATVKDSGLRRCKAVPGFPGQRWAVVRDAQPESVSAIRNADESEPGTFGPPDPATQPHLVLEGLLIGWRSSARSRAGPLDRYGPEGRVARRSTPLAAASSARMGVLRGRRLEVDVSFRRVVILGEETALLNAWRVTAASRYGHRFPAATACTAAPR